MPTSHRPTRLHQTVALRRVGSVNWTVDLNVIRVLSATVLSRRESNSQRRRRRDKTVLSGRAV